MCAYIIAFIEHAYEHVHACVYVHLCLNVCARTCVCAFVFVHVCVTHTHTHTHNTGNPTFALKYNVAASGAVSKFEIEPNSMTFEDFVCGFTDDTPQAYILYENYCCVLNKFCHHTKRIIVVY